MPLVSGLSVLLRPAFIALALVFALAGCETFEKLNPFAEKETPLPGDRKPLFPEGVPGVEFGAAPPQPSNSNIPIAPAIRSEEQSAPAPAEQEPVQSQAARPQQPAQTGPQQTQPSPSAKTSKGAKGNPDDAWAGTR